MEQYLEDLQREINEHVAFINSEYHPPKRDYKHGGPYLQDYINATVGLDHVEDYAYLVRNFGGDVIPVGKYGSVRVSFGCNIIITKRFCRTALESYHTNNIRDVGMAVNELKEYVSAAENCAILNKIFRTETPVELRDKVIALRHEVAVLSYHGDRVSKKEIRTRIGYQSPESQ